ncbi:probable bifunctional methylthioribulose-1-phosphate dehydratase/enolase-phosphatase E1 1 isoform X2 [Camellia sinensis]|uniref:probable bifunctional methylthioribulose-1-phosphate dehydratase/enolase-phosphatase E1 1 isoform X2 n=1 Tax=Camellia sinensis TaxID=4442 RepID=UPI0010356F99|nr:probable bifunctional methylthioribulose-1-phosphate dehydratase/enolase-phosphatase E1 1 isoform X2 [Camellia sinensis]
MAKQSQKPPSQTTHHKHTNRLASEHNPYLLQHAHNSVYIYSSGSRLAQRLIFGDTNYGDLRKYLCGFFATIVRNKKETSSYVEISKSMGADRPSEILFVTDVYQEAIATKAASKMLNF